MFRSSIGFLTLSICLLSPLGIAKALAIEEPTAPRWPKGFEPNFEVRIVPIQPPRGAEAYPAGTRIDNQELRFPAGAKGPVTAYFEVRVDRSMSGERLNEDNDSSSTVPAGDPLGSCCTRTETPHGAGFKCANVYTAQARAECEEAGMSSFTSGDSCVDNPCLNLVGSFSIPVRVIPPSECVPIRFRRIEGPCDVDYLHSGEAPSAAEHGAGITYTSSGEPAGTGGAGCAGRGAVDFGDGIGADCNVVIVGPDAAKTELTNSRIGRLAARITPMKIVLPSSSPKE